MRCVLPALIARVAEEEIEHPVYCFDYATTFKRACPKFGIVRGSTACCPIAPASPDMNKPIEHAIHALKAAFARWLVGGAAARLTAHSAQHNLVRLFHEKVTAASVAADVATLPDTMRAIATPRGKEFVGRDGKRYAGSGGDWAPRGLR